MIHDDEVPTDLEARLARLDQLAAEPQAMGQLLGALQSGAGADELEAIVRQDPAISTAVLRMANSAALGGVQRTERLSDAIARLGHRNLHRIAVSMQAARWVEGRGVGYGLGPGELWAGSVAGALAAEWLAARQGADSGVAYVAGLLRDIGKPVMERLVPRSDLQSCLRNVAADQVSWRAEREAFGLDHAQAGAVLADRWGLPATIVDAIRCHHEVEGDVADPDLCDLVRAADVLAWSGGWGVALEGPLRPMQEWALAPFTLDSEQRDTCLRAVERGLAEMIRELGAPA